MSSSNPPTNRPAGQEGLDRLEEWQRHQYDPGYWAGGKIPPYQLGRRPNPIGWVYILTGIMSFVGCGVMAYTEQSYYPAHGTVWDKWYLVLELVLILIPSLAIAVGGVSLLRGRKGPRRPGKKEHPRRVRKDIS